jgi:hypothetical protein
MTGKTVVVFLRNGPLHVSHGTGQVVVTHNNKSQIKNYTQWSMKELTS